MWCWRAIMVINRQRYLNKIISKKDNGLIKVITGIRRCGKSYLLFQLYHQYLNSIGVSDDCIVEIALDEILCYDEINLIRMKDQSKHIDRRNRNICS